MGEAKESRGLGDVYKKQVMRRAGQANSESVLDQARLGLAGADQAGEGRQPRSAGTDLLRVAEAGSAEVQALSLIPI